MNSPWTGLSVQELFKWIQLGNREAVQKLVERIQKGDRVAAQELYTYCTDFLPRIAMGLDKNRENQKDLVQVMLVKILSCIREGKNDPTREGSFEGWLKAIARNAAIDWLRRDCRKSYPAEVDWNEVVGGEPHPYQRLLDEEQRHEFTRIYSQFLRGLSDRDANILRLGLPDKLTLREIVELVGTSQSSVCKRLKQLRRQLQEKLKVAGIVPFANQ